MRGARTFNLVLVVALGLATWSSPADAQLAGGLGLAPEVDGLGLQPDAPAAPPEDERLRVRRSRYYYSHYGMPWSGYAAWPSLRVKPYGPPVALEPRLGLQYQYPFHWQMGLQIAPDLDPPYTYSLGGYEPVVGSPQVPTWLYEKHPEVTRPANARAIGLLQAGEYAAAGRLLAKRFRQSEDPLDAVLLAEALVGFGKPRHAELILRHALQDEAVFEVLPEDVASHFPSPEVFEEKVAALGDDTPLLTAWLSLFTADGSTGLDMLHDRMKEEPTVEVYRRLYRHYVGKVFPDVEEEAESPDDDSAAGGDDSSSST